MASVWRGLELLMLLLLDALVLDGESNGEEALCCGVQVFCCLHCYDEDFLLGCVFVGEQIRSVFLWAISDGDGCGRPLLASSLRRGGSFESSCLGGARAPAVGRCADGGGASVRWFPRGSCRCSFNGSHAVRWCRIAGCCGCFNAFGFSEDSGDGGRSTTWLCCAFRREDWSSLVKKVNFANRSIGSCLLVPFLSRVFVLKGDVLSAYVQ
jgi:hypothetical protein